MLPRAGFWAGLALVSLYCPSSFQLPTEAVALIFSSHTRRGSSPARALGRPRDRSNYLRMCDCESRTITHTDGSDSSLITRADGRIDKRGVN